ncbi:MAG: hypothetical protein ACPGVG_05630 [Mycobacterium sp.]
MAITVKEISAGSNIRWGDNGVEDTLVFFVSGLEGTTSKKRFDAMTATNVPQKGQPHPYINGIVARSCPGVQMPKGHETARVVINFAAPEDGDDGGGGGGGEDDIPTKSGISIRLGTAYERINSNYAVKKDGTRGDAIKVWWNSLIEVTTEAISTGARPEILTEQNFQPATVGNFVARPTLIFSGKSKTIPLSRSRKVGFTNGDDFISQINGRFDEVPAAMKVPDSWMLIRQSASSKDGGATVDVEREVAFRADKWLEVAVFINPATGRPPANLATPDVLAPGQVGNGFKVVRVAGQAAFKDLLEF